MVKKIKSLLTNWYFFVWNFFWNSFLSKNIIPTGNVVMLQYCNLCQSLAMFKDIVISQLFILINNNKNSIVNQPAFRWAYSYKEHPNISTQRCIWMDIIKQFNFAESIQWFHDDFTEGLHTEIAVLRKILKHIIMTFFIRNR